MASGRIGYEGGEIADRDAFRLAEPEMSHEEYQACRAAWWNEFPCRCGAVDFARGRLAAGRDGSASSSNSLKSHRSLRLLQRTPC